jgi:3D (Asp-Asp-Asp) domain-containing protein
VPKSIPLGTEIEIVNAPKSVHPYRIADDRGGAIKIKNGIYHFDVWFKTHKEALQFGRKKAVMYYKDNKIFIEMED